MGILEVKDVNKRFGGLQALMARASPPCSIAWWAS
jgi:hypothetical protein